MRQTKQDGWYSKRSFPHLDLPLSFEKAEELVTDPTRVAQHPFRPFIGFTDKKRRFTPKAKKKYKVKKRPIRYCSHWDGYIHAYYAKLLSEKYEDYLDKSSFGKSVIGYRAGLGSNIHMAKNAFNELKMRTASCAIAIDISDFFGSIDHQVLLDNIKRVLGCNRLPADWFAVYRSMTRYAWVESSELADRLEFDPKKPPKPLCSTKEFRALRSNDGDFVKKWTERHGIPQGSPISAVFSNIYMIDFDAACHEYISRLNGYYRRYSDDIFVVADPKHRNEIEEFISKEIRKLGTAIVISREKTEVSYFERSPTGDLVCDRPITYLGFTFDGRRTTLRSRTLSRYYRRMTYATRHTAKAAAESKSKKVFKRKLYRQFSHLGRSNFYSYTKRASEIHDDPHPQQQLRRHMPILKRKLERRGR